MSKEYLMYLTNQKTEAERQAFLAGCRAMLTAFRCTPADQHPRIYSTMTERHILATLLDTDQRIVAQRDAEVSALLSTCSYNKPQARAFIFNVARLDDSGREVDQDGSIIENCHYVPAPGATHRPYPNYQIIHRITGEIINQADYDRLPAKFQAGYEFVRTFSLTLHGRPIFTINSTHRDIIAQLIRNDIFISDCNHRYALAIADGSILEDYRPIVIEAFKSLNEETNFSSDLNPMLISHLQTGNIKTGGHLIIAMIQSIISAATPYAFFRGLNSLNLITWRELILGCNENADILCITDEDFETYRNVNDSPLCSAICVDSQWTLLEPGQDGESVAARKDYFRYILIPRFARKLIDLFNVNITAEDFYNLRPDTLRATLALVKCLLTYYKDGTNLLKTLIENHTY